MNVASELQKLQDLYRSGAISEKEYAIAKAAILTNIVPGIVITEDAAIQKRLEEMKLVDEVSRLDLEWQSEREKYMVTGKYGNRYLPRKGIEILIGIFIVGGGTSLVWKAVLTSNLILLLMGVFVILLGVKASMFRYGKAREYEQAYQAYLSRRARVYKRYNRYDSRKDLGKDKI